MTHEECIAVLLRPGAGPRGVEAQEHVALCSDCWAVVSLLHELAMGAPPAGDERMDTLFACASVRDRMYLLTDLDAVQIRTEHPQVARHLAWCLACRDRLGELLAVERAAARGELPPLLASPAPRWQDVPAKVGQAVREVVGRAVAEVRRAGAVFTAVPDGFLALPVAAPVGALRGAEPQAAVGLGQQVRFPLADTGLWAELTLESQGRERVGMAVRVTGAERRSIAVHVRELRPEHTELVARYTAREAAPVVVKGLPPGHYLLEIEDRQEARRFQLRFDVEAPA